MASYHSGSPSSQSVAGRGGAWDRINEEETRVQSVMRTRQQGHTEDSQYTEYTDSTQYRKYTARNTKITEVINKPMEDQ